ncbi:MAG: hypothetical protein Q7U45_01030, partial [Burkholderiaceae bacterium]|nr:hypothetical protein [Burkholderiaceae bacterium]
TQGKFPIRAAILVTVTAVEPIVAPSYRLFPSDTTEASQVASAMRTYGVVPAPDANKEGQGSQP